MICFKKDIAVRYGVNAAVVLCMIDELFHNEMNPNIKEYNERVWTRCPVSLITGFCPFFTRSMAESAVTLLVDEGIMLKRKLSDNPFDNANWYSITAKGQLMLREVII